MSQAFAQISGPILVAGHACLDVIPTMNCGTNVPGPGKLVEIGPATIACGGAVPNVGMALRKLGAPVRLVAAAGDDLFGQQMRRLLEDAGADVRLRILANQYSSYSIVLAPPQLDRSFLHAPAVNHEIDPDRDVTDADLSGAGALHFGYPTIMRRTYSDGGQSLARLFKRATDMGLITSLDMCAFDAAGDAGKVDWRAFLTTVLPFVSLFCPSLDELRMMLRSNESAQHLAGVLSDLGAAVVVLKEGSQGIYCRGTHDRRRMAAASLDERWLDIDARQGCFQANFVSANGSGDCTIAGLLAALLLGLPPRDALRMACAVGACSVEAASATGGIVPWEQVEARLAHGWEPLDNQTEES